MHLNQQALYLYLHLQYFLYLALFERLYYLFPKKKENVAKARLAAEELYIHLSKKEITV